MTVCLQAVCQVINNNYFLKDLDTGERYPAVFLEEITPGTEGLFIGTFCSGIVNVSKRDVREFINPFYEEDVILLGSEFFAENTLPFDLTTLYETIPS